MEKEAQKAKNGSGAKKLLVVLLAVLLLGGGIFGATQLFGDKYGDVAEVSDFESLKEAVESAKDARQIVLTDDIVMESYINVPVGATIQIVDDGQVRTLTRGEGLQAWMFCAIEESALTIKATEKGNIVLDGNSGSVTGNMNGCLVLGDEAHITLENVTLQSNTVDGTMGGLVRAMGGSLTMRGCVLEGGRATSGGAVAVLECDLLAEDCQFVSNAATGGHGGALVGDAESKVTLKRCTFDTNATTGEGSYYGGAVSLTNYTECVVEDCTFKGNASEHAGKNAAGGAIYVGLAATLDVQGDTVFNENHASGSTACLGGAIYVSAASRANINPGVVFTNNSAKYGGAMYCNEADYTVDGAVFENNVAEDRHGGAIAIYNNSNLTVKNTTFRNNSVQTARANYGGALSAATSSKIVVESCVFDGNFVDNTNEANSNAGAIFIGGQSRLEISGETVFRNNAGKGQKTSLGGAIYANELCMITINPGTVFEGNQSSHGGAIYSNGAKVILDGVKFVNNKSTGSHGGAMTLYDSASGSITNCVFTGNETSGGHGGGLMVYKNSVAEVSGTTFEKNKVTTAGDDWYGGAVAVATDSTATINSCVFNQNSVRHTGGANGGALSVTVRSAVKLSGNNRFTGNSAYSLDSKDPKSLGGAIYVSTECTLTGSSGSVFSGNNSTHGGAIYINRGKVDLTGATFTGNYSTNSHGGAVRVYEKAGQLTLRSCTFTKNTITGSGSLYGGALAVMNGATANVIGGKFDGNVLDHEGKNNGAAAFVSASTLNVSGGTVFQNNQSKGDGSYGAAIYANNGSTVTVGKGVGFQNNVSAAGGAICVSGAALNVEGASFTGNQALSGHGGAILTSDATNYDPAAVTVKASSFTDNAAIAGNGGAVYQNHTGTMTINGSAFAGNTVAEGQLGAALGMSAKKTMTLSGVTVTPSGLFADVDLPAGSTLLVSGKVELGRVLYNSTDSIIKLTAAVDEGSTAQLVPSRYEAGLQLVSAEDAALLAGIGSKFAVADDATTEIVWVLDDAGKLADVTPTVQIGNVGYVTLDEALAAVKEGEAIVLLADVTANTSATLPAGVMVEFAGKSITLADGVQLTLGANNQVTGGTIIGDVIAGADNMLVGTAFTGNVTLTGAANLGDAAVTGTVTVPDGVTVTVGGKFTAGQVALGTGSLVHVISDLAAEGKAFLLTSAVEELGTQLVTAADGVDLAGAVAKINASFKNSELGLGDSGCIVTDATVAIVMRDGAEYGKYNSLAAAIEAAAATDTVKLYKSTTLTETITIDKAVVIDGAGNSVIRDAAMDAIVFDITAEGSLTLNNVTVAGDPAVATSGKPLVNNAGTFVLGSDAKLSDGNADNSGDSEDKSAVSGTAGALINYGSGVATISGTIENCSGYTAGAIYNKANAQITVTDGALLQNNSGNNHAGAIYAYGKVTVTGGTFSGNKAAKAGGAILMAADATSEEEGVTLPESVLTITGGTFSGNSAGTNGGAIQVAETAEAHISGATFTGNTANTTDGLGGAISNYGTLNITGNTAMSGVSGTAMAYGGGLIYNAPTGVLTISGSGNVLQNAKANFGGAINNNAGGQVTITGATLSSCNASSGMGGAIYTLGTVTLGTEGAADDKAVVIDGNSAKRGGAITVARNADAKASSLTIHDGVTISNSIGENTSGTCGGAIYINNAAGTAAADVAAITVTITGGTFSGNEAKNIGGFVHNYRGTLTVSGGEFTGNKSKNGGAIYAASNSVNTISGGEFTGNVATSHGGAVYAESNAVLSITGGEFTGNVAHTGRGGAIWVTGAKVNVTGGTFSGNLANKQGGVLWIAGGSASVGGNVVMKDDNEDFVTFNSDYTIKSLGTSNHGTDIGIVAGATLVLTEWTSENTKINVIHKLGNITDELGLVASKGITVWS